MIHKPYLLTFCSSISQVLLVLCLVGFISTSFAETPEEKGLSIAKKADASDKGFSDSKVNMLMVLESKQGEKTTRKLRSKTLEVENDGDKAIIIFDSPGDVKGTTFLSFTHKKAPDDQWLYLPALKRVKRISSANKSGPFVGSEFAYEDISSQEIEKYTYLYLKNETMNDKEFFVIERYPVDKKSGYSKQIAWISVDNYQIYKVDYYDRKKTLLKTLASSDYKKHLDKYWRAGKFYMKNHQTGKTTTLIFSDYQFKNGFKDSDFRKAALSKTR